MTHDSEVTVSGVSPRNRQYMKMSEYLKDIDKYGELIVVVPRKLVILRYQE